MDPGLHEKYIAESIPEIPAGTRVLESGWKSPSNIALVKYWGKAEGQIPRNPSLSFSLDRSYTEMEVAATPGKGTKLDLEYLFEGHRNKPFENRIRHYLELLYPYFPFLKGSAMRIGSRNTFPHSSGIASSASSMSALALCLCSLEEKMGRKQGQKQRADDFFRKASFVARLGSGSASRSVYGGFVSWGTIPGREGTSDEFASPLGIETGPAFHSLHDAVLIVNPLIKKVSSSQGHQLMDKHPFAGKRYGQARRNLSGLIRSLADNDMMSFIRITENEALTLHGLMMSSDPGFILLEPSTLEILERIRRFREETGTFVTFTIDAGPNVHLIYGAEARERTIRFIGDELEAFCYNGQWIDDRIGEGPLEIKI
jgi:diphosphomevalonate decarboxylase